MVTLTGSNVPVVIVLNVPFVQQVDGAVQLCNIDGASRSKRDYSEYTLYVNVK